MKTEVDIHTRHDTEKAAGRREGKKKKIKYYRIKKDYQKTGNQTTPEK